MLVYVSKLLSHSFFHEIVTERRRAVLLSVCLLLVHYSSCFDIIYCPDYFTIFYFDLTLVC